MSNEYSSQSVYELFGVEILHSTGGPEMSEFREDMSARQTIELLEDQGQSESVFRLAHAVAQIGRVIQISRTSDSGDHEELLDLFTADQITKMQSRLVNYSGNDDLDEFFKDRSLPAYYEFFVNRLGMYIPPSDNSVTASAFSRFEERHTDPVENARGPLETNSREFANFANSTILKSLSDFYQMGLDIRLKGPARVTNGAMVWDRGVAECQFLILDFIASEAAKSYEQKVRLPKSHITMSLGDIATNLSVLLSRKPRIVDAARAINPVLARDIDDSISVLGEFTQEVVRRGRWGALRYEREPQKAQRQILAVQELLIRAADIGFSVSQAEIPIFDPSNAQKD